MAESGPGRNSGDLPAPRASAYAPPEGQAEGRRTREEESDPLTVLGARESRAQGEGEGRFQRLQGNTVSTQREASGVTGTGAHRLAGRETGEPGAENPHAGF